MPAEWPDHRDDKNRLNTNNNIFFPYNQVAFVFMYAIVKISHYACDIDCDSKWAD